MTRLAHHEPVAIIACCFIALVPLLLLPILPTRVAAIMHLAAAAPLTSYQLTVFAWRRRSMVPITLLFQCVSA
jgi:hypothetical protein